MKYQSNVLFALSVLSVVNVNAFVPSSTTNNLIAMNSASSVNSRMRNANPTSFLSVLSNVSYIAYASICHGLSIV